nr:immunoglobulin light chain junction region [Macaca mulatta]
CLQSYNTPYTF